MGKDRRSSVRVGDILDDSQLCHIIKKCIGDGSWQLVSAELRPAAAEGIAGFLGDHFRLTVRIKLDGRLVIIRLFVKSLPLNNAPKAEFIDEHHFNKKEVSIFKLLDEMDILVEDANPFVANALLYNESILVMRDLTPEGYSTTNQLQTFDLPHVLVTLASVARFHAAFANHETKKSLALQRPYSIVEEHPHINVESNFKDTPWIHSGAKLSANIINTFSNKYNTIPDLETKFLKQFLEACDELAEHKETLNVVLHKDLWVNNIMFKYENGVPINSILVDFQCVRYGPPAFDVTFFIYNTTSRSFREQYEGTYLKHYFNIFTEFLDVHTKSRLKVLGYDFEDFLRWIEYSKRFAGLGGIMLGPYVLMDPGTAQVTFDDPATFEKLTNEDRSEPVLAHARRCAEYKRRLVDINEEFVERYVRP
ncbi:uncharacterized protein LOC125230234 [Leguminivora glycinivorella]|uniref:uncharacterized protein LOC125230234 n=1 Tax=Leguminivora glycinivorella TaxID=1035111 RepID=UPI0020100E1F|nr:uncharacterized protein LOC125230234 [Leguminivora glycinivorella]